MTTPGDAPEVYHLDDPNRSVTLADGRVITNLPAAAYDATYAQGEPCSQIPDEVLAGVYAQLGYTPPEDAA